MTRRAFNWSELDRDMLYSMLYELKSKIVDKRLPIAEITSVVPEMDTTVAAAGMPVPVTT